MNDPARALATVDDFRALDPDGRFEILDGEIVQKAMPTGEHGDAQAAFVSILKTAFQFGRGGPGAPGGWWIFSEVDVQLEPHTIVRPDVAGWRKASSPKRPTGWPVTLRPDWVCEVLSGDKRRDRIRKLGIYLRAEIPHYWLADPDEGSLTVMRWSREGYVTVLAAERGQIVRAEPFAEIEIDVGRVLGEED